MGKIKQAVKGSVNGMLNYITSFDMYSKSITFTYKGQE
jgi:hypothetical protein